MAAPDGQEESLRLPGAASFSVPPSVSLSSLTPPALSTPFPSRPHFTLHACGLRISLGGRTLVMGILNCTPDSFSDGGRHLDPAAAALRIEQTAEEGADCIDIGGESTRPGALPVTAAEEWSRIAPALRDAVRRAPALPISVDTSKAEVARRALEEGAVIINDVSALRFDPEMTPLAARTGAGLILMHMRGDPQTMQAAPVYEDVVTEVADFLREAAAHAIARGVDHERIVIDPGIGFGKTLAHNLALIRGVPALAETGFPVLIGASRKGFVGQILGVSPEERLEGSLAAHVAAALAGAHVIRTHDVRATVRALRVADRLLGRDEPAGAEGR